MNEIMTLQPREITQNVVITAQTMGEIAYKSGIYAAPKPEAAAMIMLKGYELGFPMTAAAEYIQVIDKQIGLTPRGALALMHAHPEIIRSVKVEDLTDSTGKYYGCKCTIERYKGSQVSTYVKQFTIDDARTAGLVKPNSNWEKYAQQMCQWRAIGFAADLACPDLLGGLTGILKMGETVPTNEIGSYDVIESSPEAVIVDPAPAPAQEITISMLLEAFDAGDILAANNGVMPKTNAECTEIYNKLK